MPKPAVRPAWRNSLRVATLPLLSFVMTSLHYLLRGSSSVERNAVAEQFVDPVRMDCGAVPHPFRVF